MTGRKKKKRKKESYAVAQMSNLDYNFYCAEIPKTMPWTWKKSSNNVPHALCKGVFVNKEDSYFINLITACPTFE